MAEINNLLRGNSSGVWGTITGNIINQTDLIDYLDNNFYPLISNPSNYITLADIATFSQNLQQVTDVLLDVNGYAVTTNGIKAEALRVGGFYSDGYSFGSDYDNDFNIIYIPFTGFLQYDGANNSYWSPNGFGAYSNNGLYSTDISLGSILFKNNSTFVGTLIGNPNLTTNRNYTLPDASGQIALLTDTALQSVLTAGNTFSDATDEITITPQGFTSLGSTVGFLSLNASGLQIAQLSGNNAGLTEGVLYLHTVTKGQAYIESDALGVNDEHFKLPNKGGVGGVLALTSDIPAPLNLQGTTANGAETTNLVSLKGGFQTENTGSGNFYVTKNPSSYDTFYFGSTDVSVNNFGSAYMSQTPEEGYSSSNVKGDYSSDIYSKALEGFSQQAGSSTQFSKIISKDTGITFRNEFSGNFMQVENNTDNFAIKTHVYSGTEGLFRIRTGAVTIGDKEGTVNNTFIKVDDDISLIELNAGNTVNISTATLNYNGSEVAKKLGKSIFTPTTGDTITAVNNAYNIINSGTLLSLTIALPSSPVDGDVVEFKFINGITTVTYTGGTVAAPLVNPVMGELVKYVYDTANAKWF